MPAKAKRPCGAPRCPELVTEGRYCEQHRKAHWKQRDETRGERRQEEKKFYDSAEWKALREQQLRKEPFCRDCWERGAGTPAEMVDHIRPISLGGDRTSPANLQSLCHACHNRKRGQETRRVSEQRRPVTVVCGPPGSGKSSYVRERARDGDLVLDLDLVAHALTPGAYRAQDVHVTPGTHLRFALACRSAVLAELERPNSPTAWIIVGGAGSEERERFRVRYRAEVVVLEVPAAECLSRLYKDEGRRFQIDGLKPVIERWWQDYERCNMDTVCKP